jgi:hypothetical protein
VRGELAKIALTDAERGAFWLEIMDGYKAIEKSGVPPRTGCFTDGMKHVIGR